MAAFVLGVDGCRAGWVACRLDSETRSASFAVYPNFVEMIDREAEAAAIAVDMPIGLRNDWIPRKCDRDARSLLGPRGSSVFPAPPRPLTTSTTYREANERSMRDFDRGLSQQTFHLFPKIREVDTFLRSCPNSRIYEVHPELAFSKLGRGNLVHSKKTTSGYEERTKILKTHRVHLPDVTAWRAELGFQGVKIQRDDVADAAIAAIVALRISQGQSHAIPGESPEGDAYGLPMRILY